MKKHIVVIGAGIGGLSAAIRLAEYIELLPVEPLTRYFYGDGTVLDATRDLAHMVEQIRCLDARDVEGYLAYLSYVARLHRVTGPAFIYGAPPTWRTVTQVAPADALRLEPWLTMDAAIRRYVRSPHLRQLLGRFATYVGGSPFGRRCAIRAWPASITRAARPIPAAGCPWWSCRAGWRPGRSWRTWIASGDRRASGGLRT